MKVLVIVVCLLQVSCDAIPEFKHQYGYVIFDVYSIDESQRRNYWLGLKEKQKNRHLFSMEPIHKLVAGKYKLTHFDRSSSFILTFDDLRFDAGEFVEIEIKPDVINYLGVLALERSPETGKFNVSVYGGGGVMQRACEHSPELFETLNLRMAIPGLTETPEFKYACVINASEQDVAIK
ncbi:hypothetical protein [Microbulbifer aggregans]|uniref:hypothetical protein n=1 Tax=Microbulbifer aggregans TaxID=1769779 RepID=UPI001CFD7119|nr:hypothetical protein [Microbulbifer aggregans]